MTALFNPNGKKVGGGKVKKEICQINTKSWGLSGTLNPFVLLVSQVSCKFSLLNVWRCLKIRIRVGYPVTSKYCFHERIVDGPLCDARASICAWSTRTVSATTGKEGTTTRTPARTACSTWATSSPPSCSSASTGPRRRTSSGETELRGPI